jgi:hypothetical protein
LAANSAARTTRVVLAAGAGTLGWPVSTGIEVLPGAGDVGGLLDGGGFDQRDGFVHGVAALPLQIQNLGDAGLAGDAVLEVLQWRKALLLSSGVAPWR